MLCYLLRLLNVSLNLYCVRETPVFGLGLEKAAITGLVSSSFCYSIDCLSYASMKSLKFLKDFRSGSLAPGTLTSSYMFSFSLRALVLSLTISIICS